MNISLYRVAELFLAASPVCARWALRDGEPRS
jgi:hypothetical protein